jgi:hypothetical protein
LLRRLKSKLFRHFFAISSRGGRDARALSARSARRCAGDDGLTKISATEIRSGFYSAFSIPRPSGVVHRQFRAGEMTGR